MTYGAEFFRWFSEEAVRIHGRWSTAPNGATRLLTMKKPVGPTLMITPWNFPLAMGTRKIGPAIAAGCTMVVKPASQTPLTMLALAELLRECGLPAGVLNVVTTSHTGDVMEPLIRDARLRKLTFTGSTGIGRRLVEQSAEQLLRVSMELGGNAPFIVFEDADLDRAVDGAMLAKMRNIGEACTAANRFFVHESVAERVRQEVRRADGGAHPRQGHQEGRRRRPPHRCQGPRRGDRARRGRQGQGRHGPHRWQPGQGPRLLLRAHRDQRGADDARVMSEEIFGPVAPITTFRTEAEAIAKANSTEYGLASYVFTNDLSRVIRVSEALEYGMIGINQGIISNPAAPFGGVKASGFGREGGFEGIEEYLETTYVGIAP